jgi:3-phenylpropionate/cinnamic acid dioxygenase small subunit
MCAEVIRAVEQFLYREARLLDERRFHDWLELFTDDLRYWMPVRTSRYPKGSRAIVILDEDRYVEEELAQEGELALLDETKQSLSMRIARLDTGMAWAEDPPSRTRHLITNIEVEAGSTDAALTVYSNFLSTRTEILACFKPPGRQSYNLCQNESEYLQPPYTGFGTRYTPRTVTSST